MSNFHREVCLFKIQNLKKEGVYIINQNGGQQKDTLPQFTRVIQKSPFTNYSKFYELQEKYLKKPIPYTSVHIPSKSADSIPQYNVYLNNTHEKKS